MIEPATQVDTRSRILDAAEQLFAENGFDGTSIREITRAADVNVAAVHYHFGSKEAVLRGVADRVAEPISARRSQLLADAVEDAAPGAPSVEMLLDAFIRADIEVLLDLQERGPCVARFLGRTYGDQTEWIQVMASEQYSQAVAFYPHFAAAVPHLPASEIAWRMSQVVAVIVNLFATWPINGIGRDAAEDLLNRLVIFLGAGLRAPTPGAGGGRQPQ